MVAARDLTPDSPKVREMDARLSTLRTALGAIKRSMLMYEVLLEGCRMQEEEAHKAETLPEEPKEESTDMEMADDEGHGDPEPSDLHEEANTEVTAPPNEDVGPIPLAPGGDVVSPKEDALLMQPASQLEGPVAGPHSPRSKARTVSGEMAGLSIASPGHPEMVEDETPQRDSASAPADPRVRDSFASLCKLRYSGECSVASSEKSGKKEVGRKMAGMNLIREGDVATSTVILVIPI